MGEKNTDGVRESANVVGIGANAIGTDTRGVRYPLEWKECCREIFAGYQTHLTRKFGANVGWQRIRNMIMRDHDEYKNGRLVEKSLSLTRQDLEHWMDPTKSANLGDAKFKYVDYFLHKELLDPESDFAEAAQHVMAYREGMQLDAFQALYLGDRANSRMPPAYAIADEFTRNLYLVDRPTSEPEGFRSALYLRSAEHGRYLVTCFYFNFFPKQASEILEFGYPYFGYFLPLGTSADEKGNDEVYGVLKLFDRSLFSIKDAIYHNTSHCILNRDKLHIKIAPMESAVEPFRPVRTKSEPRETFRDFMTMLFLTMTTTQVMKHTRLDRMTLSEDELERLDNLQDQYLLW